jgi:hypothetical protein
VIIRVVISVVVFTPFNGTPAANIHLISCAYCNEAGSGKASITTEFASHWQLSPNSWQNLAPAPVVLTA